MKRFIPFVLAYPFILNPYTNTYDYVGLNSGTTIQIMTSTPTAAMLFIGCSNCIQTRLCVSSGTTRGAFVQESSPTAVCQ